MKRCACSAAVVNRNDAQGNHFKQQAELQSTQLPWLLQIEGHNLQQQQQQEQERQQQQKLSALIADQLNTKCNHTFPNQNILHYCSRLMWHTLSPCGATPEVMQQQKIWKEFGHSLHQCAAARHSYDLHSVSSRRKGIIKSGSYFGGAQDIHKTATCLNHQINKANVMKWLGLDPVLWCPPDSSFCTLPGNKKAAALSQCLPLLLTAVYLDGGMEAAVAVADVLVKNAPATITAK